MIKLRKNERRPIGILMMMFFCIVGSSITGASARDTFFLTQFDKSLLPLMFSLVAGLMVVVIYIYNKITSTLDPLRFSVDGIIPTTLILGFSLERA